MVLDDLGTSLRSSLDRLQGKSRLDEDDVETCTVVKNDGEVCGRELPCQYHGDDED